MCGILAVIGPSGETPARALVERGMAALHHRGPDAQGLRVMRSSTADCVIGLTRLRVIDVSPGADQPLHNEARSIAMSCNGELYNHVELRAELQRCGHRFQTQTDTEVIVHLYEEYNGDVHRCVSRLRGMFAFVLFDATRDRLVAARDRLGIKPLYFAKCHAGYAFSSEVRALVATGAVDTSPDITAIAQFLQHGAVPAPRSIVAAIRSLMPGTYGIWQRGTWSEHTGWRPHFSAESFLQNRDDASSLLAAALDDSVARHLVADRPVGLFLSSGCDSGALAALAARASKNVRSLTVTFPEDARTDEGADASATAARYGLAHQSVPTTGHDIAEALPAIWGSMDQPSWDAVNAWVICRAARQAGLVVCLSGIGGDELFGGYPTFRDAPRLARLLRIVRPRPTSLRNAMVRQMTRHAPGSPWARAMAASPNIEGAYGAMRGLLAQPELSTWLDAPDCIASADDWTDHPDDTGDARDCVSLLELTRYMPNQLLRDTDSVSMAHSLEVRVPLLDDTVVRVAMATPAVLRCAPNKQFLSTASGMHAVPRKRPFILPFERWTRTVLRDQLREGVLSDALPFHQLLRADARRRLWDAFENGRVHWSRPWAITALRQWPVANGLTW